jgi:hypothetical protein
MRPLLSIAGDKPWQEKHVPQGQHIKAACNAHTMGDPADGRPQQEQAQVDPMGPHTFKRTGELPSLQQWHIKGAQAPANGNARDTVRHSLAGTDNTGSAAAAGTPTDCACNA